MSKHAELIDDWLDLTVLKAEKTKSSTEKTDLLESQNCTRDFFTVIKRAQSVFFEEILNQSYPKKKKKTSRTVKWIGKFSLLFKNAKRIPGSREF